MNALYHLNIQSVLIEGGAKLLQAFIDERKWDEARVIINQELTLHDHQKTTNGLRAPGSEDMVLQEEIMLGTDIIKKFIPVGMERPAPAK